MCLVCRLEGGGGRQGCITLLLRLERAELLMGPLPQHMPCFVGEGSPFTPRLSRAVAATAWWLSRGASTAMGLPVVPRHGAPAVWGAPCCEGDCGGSSTWVYVRLQCTC